MEACYIEVVEDFYSLLLILHFDEKCIQSLFLFKKMLTAFLYSNWKTFFRLWMSALECWEHLVTFVWNSQLPKSVGKTNWPDIFRLSHVFLQNIQQTSMQHRYKLEQAFCFLQHANVSTVWPRCFQIMSTIDQQTKNSLAISLEPKALIPSFVFYSSFHL